MEKTLEKIVALAKSRGFVYPGSEIYGGLANTWDYGNLGVELKNNVKKAWWQKFVTGNPYNVGVDCAILMNPQTWVASGHLGGFSDPLMDCKCCHERFRADKLIEDYYAEQGQEPEKPIDGWTTQEMKEFIDEKNICCPTCGKHDFTDIRQFNLMFKTFQGVTEDAKNTVYLRPETAQGIFVNFKNVQRTSRKKLPFGIGQIGGKSFRNELPGKLYIPLQRVRADGVRVLLAGQVPDLEVVPVLAQSTHRLVKETLASRKTRCVQRSFSGSWQKPISKEQLISSSYSRLDGVSFGYRRPLPITI